MPGDGNPMPGRCRATNQAGKPCSAQVWRDQWCRWHHPDLAEERRAWSRKGGEGRSAANRAGKRLPKDLQDVRDTLLRALAAVETGEISPSQGQALGAIARALCQVYGVGDLEERLAALERAAAGRTAS